VVEITEETEVEKEIEKDDKTEETEMQTEAGLGTEIKEYKDALQESFPEGFASSQHV
jgi:hypothetical protein